ncbi:MAG TPA: hypothetical protein VF743_11185, partial [Acidimicrobiales bacterium]
FGYIANRYLNDLYPVVLLPGLVGFHAGVAAAPGWSARRRRLVVAGGVALVAVGALGNAAMALSYQHERGPVVPESWRADWVAWRLATPGAYDPFLVPADWPFLPQEFDGRLVIVGECQGLYTRINDRWMGVERGPAVGVHDLRVDLDRLPTGERAPLVTLGRGDAMTIVAVRRLDAERVRVDVSVPTRVGGRHWQYGTPVRLRGTVTIRVEADARQPPSLVLHGRQVLNGALLDPGPTPPRYGRAPAGFGTAVTYPGGVELTPIEPTVCREALGMLDPGTVDRILRQGGDPGAG